MTKTPWRRWVAALACAASGVAAAQGTTFLPIKQQPAAPAMPHEAPSATWPQPDYFQEALALTEFKPGERARTLSLRWDGPSPGVIVLPVQTQTFGFAPAFRALLGAQLDHALATRRINASRQTDVATLGGPFVRRLDNKDGIDALEARHPQSSLLTLYVGHDGADKAFVTLSLRSAGKTRSVHHSMALPEGAKQALASFDTVWPRLLDELKLAGAAAPAAAPAAPGCPAQTWQFERPDSPATLVCSALAIGTLLPVLDPVRLPFPADNGSPAKLAWLATAFVEAEADADPVRHAIAGLAWQQLGLTPPAAAAPPTGASDDAVLGPLRQLLAAPGDSITRPLRSARQATQSRLDASSNALPDFARSVFKERGSQHEPFHRTSLCTIERALPSLMPTSRCREENAGAPAATGRVGALGMLLHQEWRLATFHNDMVYLGQTQGQRDRLAQSLAALPADVAAHPFIAQRRFAVDGVDRLQGRYEEIRDQVQTRLRAFVQSSADLQRNGGMLQSYSVSGHATLTNGNLRDDAKIAAIVDDERRMLWVLSFDRFAAGGEAGRRRKTGSPAFFLMPGSALAARGAEYGHQTNQTIATTAASAPSVPPRAAIPFGIFDPRYREAPRWTDAGLEKRIASYPTDMASRVVLAMHSLKKGDSAERARQWIDAQPVDRREDNLVQQSHLWAMPAHAYFLSGELTGAKRYYERVRSFRTGSGSDLQAGMRLQLMAGDIKGAQASAQSRFARYPDDYALRDAAVLLFMTGEAEQAWSLILPRLAATDLDAPWVAALVGHRMQHRDLTAVRSWGHDQRLDKSQVQRDDALTRLLFVHATLDRRPSDAALAVLGQDRPFWPDTQRWVVWARLLQMATGAQASAAELEGIRKTLKNSDPYQWRDVMPWYTLASIRTGAMDDAELVPLAEVSLETGDFAELLAAALRACAQGQHEQAQRYLRAARHEISSTSTQRTPDQPLPMAYQAALAGYLMFRDTGRDPYRVEALQLARDFQGVTPHAGWTHALQALLERDGLRQAQAACRARALDADSYFLSLMKPLSAGKAPACRNPAW